MMIEMDLLAKKCAPCRGGTEPLGPDPAREMLSKVPGWKISEDNTRISREYKLRDFRAALDLVNRVGELAEAEGHHPDIRLHGWNRVEFVSYTHKIGGLHENDFILAAKIDALAAKDGIN